MKESSFMHYVQTITNWEANNVFNVDISRVRTNPDGAQVRQDGTDSTHVEQLGHSITTFGQKVPITVEDMGKDVDGFTIYEIVDGNHRYTTIKKLGNDNPNDRRWDHIKLVIKTFASEFDRLEYQTEANAHETPAKVSTIHDATKTIANIIAYGCPGSPPEVASLYNSAGRNLTEPTKYEKALKKAAKRLFPGLSAKQRSSVVRNLQGKELPGKFARYTAGNAKSAFIDWIEQSNGGSVNEDFLHTVKNHNYIDWQLVGRLFSVRSDDEKKGDPDTENIVIMFWSDITGKSNSDIDTHRRKMLKLLNKRNRSWLLKTFRGQRVKLVDRVFIAPQKRDGSCQENGFWEVETNSRGEFSLTKLPTMGWNTLTEVDSEAAK